MNRRYFMLSTATMLCAAIPAFEGATAADLAVSAADRKAIEAIVSPFERSPAAFADVDWENAFGGRRRGFEAMTAFLTERVTPTLTNRKVEQREIRFTPVTPDVVVADKYLTLSGQTDGPGGAVLPDRNVRQTYVLRRSGSGWEVAAERITDLRAPMTTPDPPRP